MVTEVEFVNARTARAKLVDGVLRVRMPRHWPDAYRDQTIAKFERWAARHHAVAESLPPLDAWDGRRWGEAEFGAYVRRLNDETLRAPLAAVRIGSARRSRLAQANTQTGVLTFSRFAIDGMPERALRYLVLHELAHLYEANHSARFWALVEAHEPDYRRQRAIAQAHHARMADRADQPGAPRPAAVEPAAAAPPQPPAPGHVPAPPQPSAPGHVPAPIPAAPAPTPASLDPDAHPFGPLFAFLPTR